MMEAQIGELSARIAGGNSAVFSLIQIVCHALETRGVVTQAEIAEAVSRCANITVPDAKDRAQVIGQALLTGLAVQPAIALAFSAHQLEKVFDVDKPHFEI